MSTPYLSEIRIFTFNFPPKGWATCNGQLMAINQNQALFSLLGTYYGGDGETNFALPNLQGRVPMHVGADGLGDSYVIGQNGGEVNHTLIYSEMPEHSHGVTAGSGAANTTSPQGNLWASGNSAYDTLPPSAGGSEAGMSSVSVANAGSSQAHNNLQPYLALNFCIALSGIFPSQN